MKKLSRITLRYAPETEARLITHAEKMGRSKSWLGVVLIENGLERLDKKKKKRK